MTLSDNGWHGFQDLRDRYGILATALSDEKTQSAAAATRAQLDNEFIDGLRATLEVGVTR